MCVKYSHIIVIPRKYSIKLQYNVCTSTSVVSSPHVYIFLTPFGTCTDPSIYPNKYLQIFVEHYKLKQKLKTYFHVDK